MPLARHLGKWQTGRLRLGPTNYDVRPVVERQKAADKQGRSGCAVRCGDSMRCDGSKKVDVDEDGNRFGLRSCPLPLWNQTV
jgi:hypothetical protein